ncbi:hypothetical protein [Bosea sp. (in: a-proteobacteria)]|uniref:hypothetical protein n=1 Tax=Bosea sp. (in: a-proteobacteria) TaxID=1871050 RepID=UPI004034D26E
MSDYEFCDDRLTAKLLVYWAFDPIYGKVGSIATAGIFLRNYLQYVRWRLANGIPSNRHMTQALWGQFFEKLREAGPLGLLPIYQRAIGLVAQMRSGDVPIPQYVKGAQVLFDYEAVARLLGVANGRQIPANARTVIRQFADDCGFQLRPYQQRAFAKQNYTRDEWVEVNDRNEVTQEETGLTLQRLQTFLMPVTFLWTIRDRIVHDPVGADPLLGTRNVAALARSIARTEGQRTMTVPPLQACTLINAALTWVLEYGPQIREGVATVQRAMSSGKDYDVSIGIINAHNRSGEFREDVPGPWPLNDVYWPGRYAIASFHSDRPTLRTVLFEYLAVSCMIVIAAFSARRIEEIESLRDDALRNENGDYWLSCWIGKNIRDIESIPVPNSVAVCIDTLLWLSESARRSQSKKWIFEFLNLISTEGKPNDFRRASFDVYRSLERFARYVNVPALPDGTFWVPKPHQFRRFFGVVYYNRYRYRHLTALSRFYRHFDPDRTRRYIAEAASGAFLREEDELRAAERRSRVRTRYAKLRAEDFEQTAVDFRTERFINVVRGGEFMGGWGGDVLRRQLNELILQAKASLDVGPADDLPEASLSSIVGLFAKGIRLEPNGLGHSYCKCSHEPQDLRVAGCLRERSDISDSQAVMMSAPDPAFAADTVCSGCPHNVQFEECKPYWEEMIRHEAAQKACALSPLLRALSGERHNAASDHLARCFDPTDKK